MNTKMFYFVSVMSVLLVLGLNGCNWDADALVGKDIEGEYYNPSYGTAISPTFTTDSGCPDIPLVQQGTDDPNQTTEEMPSMPEMPAMPNMPAMPAFPTAASTPEVSDTCASPKGTLKSVFLRENGNVEISLGRMSNGEFPELFWKIRYSAPYVSIFSKEGNCREDAEKTTDSRKVYVCTGLESLSLLKTSYSVVYTLSFLRLDNPRCQNAVTYTRETMDHNNCRYSIPKSAETDRVDEAIFPVLWH